MDAMVWRPPGSEDSTLWREFAVLVACLSEQNPRYSTRLSRVARQLEASFEACRAERDSLKAELRGGLRQEAEKERQPVHPAPHPAPRSSAPPVLGPERALEPVKPFELEPPKSLRPRRETAPKEGEAGEAPALCTKLPRSPMRRSMPPPSVPSVQISLLADRKEGRAQPPDINMPGGAAAGGGRLGASALGGVQPAQSAESAWDAVGNGEGSPSSSSPSSASSGALGSDVRAKAFTEPSRAFQSGGASSDRVAAPWQRLSGAPFNSSAAPGAPGAAASFPAGGLLGRSCDATSSSSGLPTWPPPPPPQNALCTPRAAVTAKPQPRYQGTPSGVDGRGDRGGLVDGLSRSSASLLQLQGAYTPRLKTASTRMAAAPGRGQAVRPVGLSDGFLRSPAGSVARQLGSQVPQRMPSGTLSLQAQGAARGSHARAFSGSATHRDGLTRRAGPPGALLAGNSWQAQCHMPRLPGAPLGAASSATSAAMSGGPGMSRPSSTERTASTAEQYVPYGGGQPDVQRRPSGASFGGTPMGQRRPAVVALPLGAGVIGTSGTGLGLPGQHLKAQEFPPESSQVGRSPSASLSFSPRTYTNITGPASPVAVALVPMIGFRR